MTAITSANDGLVHDEKWLESCTKRLGFKSPHSILLTTKTVIVKKLNMTEDNVEKLWLLASQCIFDIKSRVEGIPTVSEKECWLSTGDAAIDRQIGGGIKVGGGITEITGESASGKTQLGLQLCLQAQLPKSMGGLEGEATYISTECAFPLKRMTQMIQSRLENDQSLASNFHTPASVSSFLSKIHISTVHSREEFVEIIHKELPLLLYRRPVKLIVIDSIAADFRFSDNEKDWFSNKQRQEWFTNRTRTLDEVANQLKILAHEFNIAVVCINQIRNQWSDENEQQRTNISSHSPAINRAKLKSSHSDLSSLTRPSKIPKLTAKNRHHSNIAGMSVTTPGTPPASSSSQDSSSLPSSNVSFPPSKDEIEATENDRLISKGQVPALGLGWSNNINTRIALYRERDSKTTNIPSPFTSTQSSSTAATINYNNINIGNGENFEHGVLPPEFDFEAGLRSRWWLSAQSGVHLTTWSSNSIEFIINDAGIQSLKSSPEHTDISDNIS